MKQTALHALHKKSGAKMGAFAGYDMPLYYGEGVIKEHEWVRSSCGLFDVSHMGQAMIEAPEGSSLAMDLMHKLTPSSFEKLKPFRTKYTVLTNPQGGIIDDMMVTKISDNIFHFVLNAGCKDRDMAWIRQHLPQDVKFTHYHDWALLALQGQKAEAVVREILGIDLSDLPYMGLWAAEDYSMFINRLGYTGEDGFEISVKNEYAPDLWEKLLRHEAVKPAGLAARDSLRLEMGYALYGHDIDDSTSPVEANLRWIIGKDARGYFGHERIEKELSAGTERLLAGIKLLDKGVAREGAEIRNEDGRVIGALTSGGFSPSLQKSIGQGYIETNYAAPGTKVFVHVRGRNIDAQVENLPFIPARTKSTKPRKAA